MAAPVNSGLVRNLTPFFWRKNSAAMALTQAIGAYQILPALRGFWPGSAIGEASMVDLSGNGNHAPGPGTSSGVHVASSSILVPYVELDGTAAYEFTNSAATDIDGTEAFVSPPGLTLGAWVNFDALGSNEGIIGEGVATGSLLAYRIDKTTGNTARFGVSSAGSFYYERESGGTMSAATWYFVAGRYDSTTPQTSVWLDDARNDRTSSIPSSINTAGASPFQIGADGDDLYMDGKICMAFLCACALPDDWVFWLYEMSRPIFGK